MFLQDFDLFKKGGIALFASVVLVYLDFDFHGLVDDMSAFVDLDSQSVNLFFNNVLLFVGGDESDVMGFLLGSHSLQQSGILSG